MTAWLIDTFIYTAALIAVVLFLRRPVARLFGPQVAYALWMLPLVRFLLPPVVLPASMAPDQAPAPIAAEAPLMIFVSDPVAEPAAQAAPALWPAGLDPALVLVIAWLAGAALFLVYRARDYAAMKRDLLAEARPVGNAGKVLLVETPAVSSPVAFGVRRKFVALPLFFMAREDRTARDLAIAHELAHHRAHDLLANMAAQPVLALHWFNPLAWWGWRAMRADQEAACDARVVAGCGRSQRAAYAQVIAGFAAGDELALAAPMACPVLGEKSIIHRLRSLTMTEHSSRRRRFGIAAIATSALAALPLTASISYAQPDLPEPPAAPQPPMPPAMPQPPEAPDAPSAPSASLPPDSPLPPQPPAIEAIDPDAPRDVHVVIKRDEEGAKVTEHRIVTRDLRRGDRKGPSEAEIERMHAEIARELAHVDRDIAIALAEAERSSARAEVGRARAEAARERAEAQREMALARRELQEISVGSECSGDQPVVHRQLDDGRQVVMVCAAAINKQAVDGMRAAMEAIRRQPGLSDELRREILDDMRESLDELRQESRQSFWEVRGSARAMVSPVTGAPFKVSFESCSVPTAQIV